MKFSTAFQRRKPFLIKRRRARWIGTRLYFPSSGSAAVWPVFSADWEDTTSASPARRPLQRFPSGTAMTTVSFTDLNADDRDILMYQGVSLPLSGAQTVVAQRVRLSLRASETLATNNMFVTWNVRVFSNDGGTLRGTVLGVTRDDVEVATSLTCRDVLTVGSAVSAQDGDRIVVELGVGGDPLTSHDSSIRVGDAATGDLPSDDASTSDLNPYIQFEQSFTFGAEAVVGRTTRNTDPHHHGVNYGMSFWMKHPYRAA
jgi:hypothetical protein